MFLAKPQSRKAIEEENLVTLSALASWRENRRNFSRSHKMFLAKPQSRNGEFLAKPQSRKGEFLAKPQGRKEGISREAAGTQRRISRKVLNQGKSALSAGIQIVNSQIANQNLYIICNFNC